jgi:cytochrome b561
MIAQYLVLAIVLAVTLNHGNRFVRAGGTLLAAIELAFIVLSIYLADTDGTFAAVPAANFRPILLNAQAVTALAAIAFLLWAAWSQLRRRSIIRAPWRNTSMTFGLMSRYAHWATAILVLCLIPIGLFMQILRPAAPDRAVFLAVHETLGVTVLGLVVLRLAWLACSQPPPLVQTLRPWERRLAHAVHPALYALILSMPVTGVLLTIFGGHTLRFYGLSIASPVKAAGGAPWRMLHDQILPILFYAIFTLHLGAVLKHHFIARRKEDVRRMLL